jgi:alpha-tubulin suppressor-like RCC1 family protein/ribosomal protein L13E
MNHLLLIDSRVNDSILVTQSLLPDVDFVIVNFQEDTLQSLVSRIQNKKYNSVGIFQENYELPTYQFLNSFENSTLENVQQQDPELTSWGDFIELLTHFRNNFDCKVVDLMGCGIYSSSDWKYVLNKISGSLGITLNSSIDNTGAESLGGNWILESSNENLIGTYFNENIKNYKFILGVGYKILFLTPSGDVYACGNNFDSRLGTGSDSYFLSYPNKVPTLSNIIAVSNGFDYSMFLDNSGNVYACGLNNYGQLGLGDRTRRTSPVKIQTLSNIISISTGNYHSMFLTSDGDVYACGLNNYGQLGLGDTTGRTSPVKIQTLSNIISISTGNYHSMFLTSDGQVYSCGRNNKGQLGIGTTTTQYSPVKIQNLSNITTITTSYCSFFINSKGDVYACGSNSYGELGIGSINDQLTPIIIPTLSNIISVSCGLYYSLFVTSDGDVYSCGNNSSGQLGIGTTTTQYSLIKIQTLSNITSVFAIYDSSYFFKSDGTIYSCGNNSSGQLGLGDTTERTSPVQNIMNIILARLNGILLNNSSLDSFTLSQKRFGGYTIAEMKAAGYTTTTELKTAGYTATEMKTAGYTLSELKTAGYTAAELKDAQYTATELKDAGYTATELKYAGYTVTELKATGYTATEMKSIPVTTVNYLENNYNFDTSFPNFSTANTLFDGVDDYIIMIDLTTYNYLFKYIHVSSNGWIQLSDSNVSPSESNVGTNNNLPTNLIRIFSDDLFTTVKYTITPNYIYLNYTGYISGDPSLTLNINIAIDTNFIIVAKYILSSNYTNNNVLVGFTGSNSSSSSDDLYLINNTSAKNLYNLLHNKCVQFYSKITAIELKDAGYTATEMKDAGYTAAEMKDAGYTLSELIAAGYTKEDFSSIGIFFNNPLNYCSNCSDC